MSALISAKQALPLPLMWASMPCWLRRISKSPGSARCLRKTASSMLLKSGSGSFAGSEIHVRRRVSAAFSGM